MKITIEFNDKSKAEISENILDETFKKDLISHIQCNWSPIGSFRSIPENYTRTLKNICNLISNEAEFVINNRRYEEK